MENKKYKRKKKKDLWSDYGLTEHENSIEEILKKEEYENTDINLEDPSNKSLGMKEEAIIKGRNFVVPERSLVWEILKFSKHFIGIFPFLLLLVGATSFTVFFIDMAFCISDSCKASDYFTLEYLYIGFIVTLSLVVSGLFTYFQKSRTEKLMMSLSKIIPKKCIVIRHKMNDDEYGINIRIRSENLNQGDLVRIERGSYAPADLRIIWSNNLKVDNFCLTGQSRSVERNEITENPNTHPMLSRNTVFLGSLITEGEAIGLVIRTGNFTLLGCMFKRIFGLSKKEKFESSLNREITLFFIKIFLFIVVLLIVFWILSMFVDWDHWEWSNSVFFLLGFLIASIPNSFLSLISLSLALGVTDFSQTHHVTVRSIDIVELLASLNAIVVDKSTLTDSKRMKVSHLYFDETIWDVSSEESNAAFTSSSSFRRLQHIAILLGGNTFFEPTPENLMKKISNRTVIGNDTEAAILRFYEPIFDVIDYRSEYSLRGEIPFNSTTRVHLTIHSEKKSNNNNSGKSFVCLCGAPEEVIDRCSQISFNGKETSFSNQRKDRMEQALKFLCEERGERVIAFASKMIKDSNISKVLTDFDENSKEQKNEEWNPQKDFTFYGLMGIRDDPIDSMRFDIQELMEGGVKVIMATGDHPLTANYIGKRVGILKDDDSDDNDDDKSDSSSSCCYIGNDLPDLDDEKKWSEILKNERKKGIVFGRMDASDKLILMRALKRRGIVSAFFGGKINDVYALKTSDIGVCAKNSSTDVAKYASDVLLENDDLSSFVSTVRQSRVVFENMKKMVIYVLSSSTAEVLCLLLFGSMGLPLILSVMLIIVIEYLTDVCSASTYSTEKEEEDVMKVKKKNQMQKRSTLIDTSLIGYSVFILGVFQFLAAFFTYCVVMAEHGFPIPILPGKAFISFFPHRYGVSEERITDYYGVGRGKDYQQDALREAQTAVFVTIVMMQLANRLFITRTRRKSVFSHGIFHNKFMWIGTGLQLIISMIFVYVPFLGDEIIGTRPIRLYHWFLFLPFAGVLMALEEIRKVFVRQENTFAKMFFQW